MVSHGIIENKILLRDYSIDGLNVYVDHTSTGTINFVSAEKDVVFLEHSHAAQWTIAIGGECSFTANDKTEIYRKGDTYFIPSGLKHQNTLKADYSKFDNVDDLND